MSPSRILKSLLTLAAAALLLAPALVSAQGVWRPLGPNPSKDAAADDDIKNEESGRVLAIAIHPTNPKVVYVGTADGGLYVSKDGGQAWTSINLPNPAGAVGQSQAVGAIAFAPADPTTLFIGTGQDIAANNTAFGVGVYVIKNADTAPVITGPFNVTGDGKDIFTGRSISAILVDPNDANAIFVSTGDGGAAGIGDTAAPDANRPMRGIYRSRNALSANPTFTQVTDGDSPVKAMVFEPGNSNALIYAALGLGDDDGGIFRTENAADEKPTFKKTLPLPFNKISRLAINKVGGVVTVLLATNEKQAGADAEGTLRKSVDGGLTFSAPLKAASGFGGDNLVLEIDPTNADVFYLGGSTAASGKNIKVITETLNGGATFTPKGQVYTFGVHPDTQVIRVAPSDPSFVYVGGDGGMWKTTKGGKNWLTDQPMWEDLNNTTFSATQFNGIAQHPKLRNFIFGGAQDNGSPFMGPDMNWVEFVGGDGGVALIDSNATATSDVTIYHTFNQDAGKKIKFDRITVPAALLTGSTQAIKDGATTVSFGAGEGATPNGITVTDKIQFYNPMALGPGTPNTLYFGSDRLYRSDNQGTTMTVVSQAPLMKDVPLTAVGVSPQDDTVRIVGLKNGKVFATTTGDSNLRDVTISRNGQPISSYVSRTVIDPNNRTTAYVTFADYGLAGAGVWKTSNLDADAPTWAPAGNGIPDVPVNAFAIDPRDSTHLYAGTDIGVYSSVDGGQNWSAFGTGLPRMQVFDMAVQPDFGLLRIGTYGRGVWEIETAPTANAPTVIATNGNTQGAAARPNGPNQRAGGLNPTVTFSISLAAPSTRTVTFNYTTVDGTAVAGTDYAAQSGTITFAPGETQKTITVDVITDPNPDADETFYVDLSNPSDASLSTSRLTGTIVSTQPLPTLSINSSSVLEGAPGELPTATFTVSLTATLPQDVQVSYQTEEGTAQEGNDFQPTRGVVTIRAGQISADINVPVRGDALPEEDETFFVRLSNVVGDATLGNAVGVGTIQNDDALPPYVSFTNTQSITINDNSSASLSQITVSGVPSVTNKVTVRLNDLNHAYPDDVSVLLVSPTGQKAVLMAHAGGGLPVEHVNLNFDDAAIALVPNDDSFASGKFQPADYGVGNPPSFPAGAYSARLSAFNGADPNGTWTLYVLDDAAGDAGVIARGWSLTVAASDGTLPALTIADASQTEALSATVPAQFVVRLSAPSSQTVTVDYTTDDGTGLAGGSYASTSGTLTFAPGVVEQTISVGVLGGTAPGANLTFFVNLSNPSAGVVLANNQAKGTVINDNVIPEIRINDLDEPKEIEEGSGEASASLTVSLSAPSRQEVTVDFTTVDGEAVAGVDYQATSGTLVFAPGEVSQDVTVPVIVNDTNEQNKHFTIKLSNAVNGVIVKDEGDAVIVGSHAPTIKTHPFDHVVVEGDSVSFRVEATGDNLTYQWRYNDVDIPNTNSARLTLPKVVLSNAGEYSVLVKNSLGEDVSNPATLDVIGRLPIKRLAGAYQGLIQGNSFQQATTGGIRLFLGAGGSFTGGLSLGGKNYSIRGRFDANGQAAFTAGSGASTISVHLQLDLTGGGIKGTVTSGGVTSNLFAEAGAKTAQPGAYTVLLPRNPAHPEASFPQGNGYAGLSILRDGSGLLVGRLGDGTLFSQATHLSADGFLTLYVPLYGGAGSISGALEFRTVTGKSDVDGTLDWYRPELFTKFYPQGFQTQVDVIGSLYRAPAAGAPVLGFTSGTAEFYFPETQHVQDDAFTVDANSRATAGANSNHFTLRFFPKTGIFIGKVADGPSGTIRGFVGVLLPSGRIGGGEFFSGTGLGSVNLFEAP